MTGVAASGRTLLFCTSFVPAPGIPGSYVPSAAEGTAYMPGADGLDRFYSWECRYRIWLDAVRRSSLRYDQILIVDDGSPVLPSWDDIEVIEEAEWPRPTTNDTVLFHFARNLGRRGVSDFPGWVRSFFFAARYARECGFTRIIHLESDAFLISSRMVGFANRFDEGWGSVWCPRHQRPESGIQFIAGSGLDTFATFASRPYDELAGCEIEVVLPFTHVERSFTGDRYGEVIPLVPLDADWCMQARPAPGVPFHNYYWWLEGAGWPMDEQIQTIPDDVVRPEQTLTHDGVFYLDMLGAVDVLMRPRNYLEIGTNAGHSVQRITCDAVCVDPAFVVNHNVLGARRRTFFYQGTSDEFFADVDVGRHFPVGIDLAFLDGLHLFEALLRDFINVERHANRRTLVLLHDCLPLNARMAERERRLGGAEEDAGTRDWWTGDVWKVLLILREFRPDLRIGFLDCGPTGLVACSGLDPTNTVLVRAFDTIVRDFSPCALDLRELRTLFPTWRSRELITSPSVFRRVVQGA